MKRIFLVFLFCVASSAFATSDGLALLTIKVNLHEKARLQRGARLFMNYCSGCHSLRYLRYNRMARDLGLTTFDGQPDSDLLYNNLLFTQAKVQDPIEISLPPEDALQWFGVVPPDLSLSARQRGADWLYTYLKSFYADPNRPYGANNLLVPDVAMPNILLPLQGWVVAKHQAGTPDTNGHVELLLVAKGSMAELQFDSALQDLVTFLAYVSEPDKLLRERYGIWVILFLSVLSVVAYLLKRAYWRKIH